MRALFAATALLLVLSACDGGDSPDAGTMPTACGAAGAAPAGQCTALAGCGAGSANQIKVSFCEHCFTRPDTHLCEAGSCRALGATGTIMFGFTVPMEATGAQSFTVASVNPVMADGARTSCAALLGGGCNYVDNGAFNTGNSRFSNIVGGADPSSAYTGVVSAEAGEGRLLFIEVTAESQGRGAVKARGCKEGITVVAGMAVPVELALTP